MTEERLSLGKKGEDFAAKLLKKRGYKIKERNYRSPAGEIDIIAIEGKTLAFVEVKTRSSNSFGTAEEAVNIRKQRQIIRAAMYYLQQSAKKEDSPARFDVVSVRADGKALTGNIIKNAFELS
jgi:putative endonuclease